MMLKNNLIALLANLIVMCALCGICAYTNFSEFISGNIVSGFVSLMTIGGLFVYTFIGYSKLHNLHSSLHDLLSVIGAAIFGCALSIPVFLCWNGQFGIHEGSVMTDLCMVYTKTIFTTWAYPELFTLSDHLKITLLVVYALIPSMFMWLGLQWKRRSC